MFQKLTALILRLSAFAAFASTPLATLAETRFERIPTQYIAALGPSNATSGSDAATWGLWPLDPGPRGVRPSGYDQLLAAAGRAPAGWTFDETAWWVEENGLIMESPNFPLPAGTYVVTGGRETTALLTVSAPDAAGQQDWSLSDGATIYDVTHLRCRAALYTARTGESCSPANIPERRFPIPPAEPMPAIDGCTKRDYQVLIVIGKMAD